MAGFGQDVRRVSLYADALNVDLTLPAAVPVAALLPPIRDVLATHTGFGYEVRAPQRYQLSCPGMDPLDSSMTLAENDIHDGAVLVLTRSSTELPAPVVDDSAQAVSVTLAAVARPWTRRAARLTAAAVTAWLASLGGALLVRNTFSLGLSHQAGAGAVGVAGCGALLAAVIAHRVYRDEITGLTFGLLATGFAGIAGFLAVPDGPGAPNVLLAAMAAGVGSVSARWLTGCGFVTFTTVACVAMSIAGAALAAVITTVPMHVIGALSVLVSMGLLEAAARISIAWAGLSPPPPGGIDEGSVAASDKLHDKAIRADARFTTLMVGFATTATIGAICTVSGTQVAGGPQLLGIVFTAITGAVLLLRTRSDAELTRALALCGAGTATVSATLFVAAASQHTEWLVTGIALLTGVVVCSAFVVPAATMSPVARRGLELLEYSGLAALVPLACCICGFYSAVRGVHLI